MAVDSKKLSYFMSVQITNPETEVILKRALQQYNINTVPAWPGKDFEFVIPNNKPQQPQLLEMEAALALLGMHLPLRTSQKHAADNLRLAQWSRRRLFHHPT